MSLKNISINFCFFKRFNCKYSFIMCLLLQINCSGNILQSTGRCERKIFGFWAFNLFVWLFDIISNNYEEITQIQKIIHH